MIHKLSTKPFKGFPLSCLLIAIVITSFVKLTLSKTSISNMKACVGAVESCLSGPPPSFLHPECSSCMVKYGGRFQEKWNIAIDECASEGNCPNLVAFDGPNVCFDGRCTSRVNCGNQRPDIMVYNKCRHCRNQRCTDACKRVVHKADLPHWEKDRLCFGHKCLINKDCSDDEMKKKRKLSQQVINTRFH